MRKLLAAGVTVVIGITCAWTLASSSSIATTSVSHLYVEPAAGYAFIDHAISDAKQTVDVSMYELSDSVVENALIARAKAGVLVRVILNADYEGRSENADAAQRLKAGGVHVVWAPANQIFHAKYVVIDDRYAYVGTGNFVSYDYPTTRDFWVEVVGSAQVRAIAETFASDFAGHSGAGTPAPGLVWSPGSTSALVDFIDQATSSVLVENEEMDNDSIERALETTAKRGVAVYVVMAYDSEWTSALNQLRAAGVKVSTLAASQVYIHAKVICDDCTTAHASVFIGSENFSTASLVYNRELGVLTTSKAATSQVNATVRHDYAIGEK